MTISEDVYITLRVSPTFSIPSSMAPATSRVTRSSARSGLAKAAVTTIGKKSVDPRAQRDLAASARAQRAAGRAAARAEVPRSQTPDVPQYETPVVPVVPQYETPVVARSQTPAVPRSQAPVVPVVPEVPSAFAAASENAEAKAVEEAATVVAMSAERLATPDVAVADAMDDDAAVAMDGVQSPVVQLPEPSPAPQEPVFPDETAVFLADPYDEDAYAALLRAAVLVEAKKARKREYDRKRYEAKKAAAAQAALEQLNAQLAVEREIRLRAQLEHDAYRAALLVFIENEVMKELLAIDGENNAHVFMVDMRMLRVQVGEFVKKPGDMSAPTIADATRWHVMRKHGITLQMLQ